MISDQFDTCRRLAPADRTIEDFLNDPLLRASLEEDGIDPADLADLLTALRTRLLAQRWRHVA